MEAAQYFKKWQVLLLIIILSFAAFFETSIPYLYAEKQAPPANQFLGQISYIPDQSMYFSFIGQAHDGRFIFNNRLTGIPNPPVFINLEFWLVGFIERVSGISENAVYHVWRYLGVLLLAVGIYLLARLVLPSRRRILIALVLLMFSGGFGFIFAFLSKMGLIGFDATHNGIMDMRYGIMPLQQMMTNPHFTFPHGLILIAYSLFLMGERGNKTSYYIFSGLTFTVIGLVRPYDIIPPVFIFPIFIAFTNQLRIANIKIILRKLLPLIIIVPVFAYNLWLFKVNDIFKFWAQQGLNANSSPGPLWNYFAFGIIGILAIYRLFQIKEIPLNLSERFLLVLFAITFLFIQLGKIFPAIGWSPQIGVYLSVPLALLGCSARLPQHLNRRRALVFIVCVCLVCSNVAVIGYFVKNFTSGDNNYMYYVSDEEMASWKWLKLHSSENDVVLADIKASQCIEKYTSARLVLGHYSVTPHYAALSDKVGELIGSPALGIDQKQLLTELNADLIYVGPDEKNIKIEESGYIKKVYSDKRIAIFRINRNYNGR